jgi:hypothetical protein
LSATTWWLTVSSLRQRMESPVLMVRVAGLNPAGLIATTLVTAASAYDAVAAAMMAARTNSSFLMG